jgi:dolichyl-diphosphooligosaccharide--protein glycosyltransferase
VSLKSKKWVADPANHLCDAPGSWYCTGQYPPALAPLIGRRKNFAQLEDFNTKRGKEDEEYDREYHERMSGQRGAAAPPASPSPPIKYVGCVGSEAALGEDRLYEGGGYGSSAEMGAAFAREVSMRYVALARVDEDGHAFAFSTLPKKSQMVDDVGCGMPCADDAATACGCADELCGGLGAAPGEEHVRRWALYKVGAPHKKKQRGKDEV